jgi:hypothetical protein
MTDTAVDVARAAGEARVVARATAAACRLTRIRSRLLRAQSAALRAKLDAGSGRTQTRAVYTAMLGEIFASAGLMDDLSQSRLWPDRRASFLQAAQSGHRRILERYAAFGPSLPN